MFLFWCLAASAQETVEEVEVTYEPLSVAYASFQRQMGEAGYGEPILRDGYRLYRHERDLWRPNLRLYNSGFVDIRRSPVRAGWASDPGVKQVCFGVPIARKDGPLDLSSRPVTRLLTDAYCLKLDGLLVGRRLFRNTKSDLVGQVHPQLLSIQAALQERDFSTYLEVDLPRRLNNLWRDGTPIESRGAALQDASERRAALVVFWTSRLDTPEGDQARGVVEDFIERVVQTSASPFLEEWWVEPESMVR